MFMDRVTTTRDAAAERLPWGVRMRDEDLAGPGAASGPVLVGGVGNPWAGDLDFGPWFVRAYRDHGWPDGVVIEEICISAHRVLHLLRELRPGAVVLVAGYPRGQPPGSLRRYRPDRGHLDEAEVQQRLGESAAGVIDLDHLLAVTTFYGDLPADTTVIEVEPASTEFSDVLSPTVTSRGSDVLALVKEEVARLRSVRRRDGRWQPGTLSPSG